jgi:O-antigen/teichoic acid export membrane protein
MQLTIPFPNGILRNKTLLVYADQALVSGFSFLSGVVMARYLGVEGFGGYSVAWLERLLPKYI